MQTANALLTKNDEKFRSAFVFSPSWGHEYYFLADSVGLSFWCRDHGDREPVDTVDDLGLTFAEFCRCLKMAQTEGKAEAGHLTIARQGGDGISTSYRFGYFNHFYQREHYFNEDASAVQNLLNMVELLAHR
ncbi:MAG: hypothetical protein JSS83_24520 [Cyanobacteria bacterium SZAS LIN-3]|nr:hypothetical protein [Cyanobacteria bacterium SZAS LIN-3]